MIKLQNVSKTYNGKGGVSVKALSGVSLDLPRTGMVFVLGKSGSGKSTMLNILGLLDDFEEGELLINGRSAKGFTENERDAFRAENIGFVFQEFHIIDKYTIGQNVSLPIEIQSQSYDHKRICDVLERVGLSGYAPRNATEISGGQKQRVAIARSIIKNPQIILADEPTGSLDSITSNEILKLLKDLSREKLVIIVSHDIESARRYADQIIELADGKIVGNYAGDGTFETVRITLDGPVEAHATEIKKHIESGKNVLLVKPSAKPVPPMEHTRTKNQELPQSTSRPRYYLPFRSKCKLSMLAIRSRWVRMTFTVLLAVFAIAFLGFADMVAQYSIDNILVQEIEKSGAGFVSVSAERVRDETDIFPTYTPTLMSKEVADVLQEADLDFVKNYSFLYAYPQVAWFENYFPDQSVTGYYENTLRGFIECDDLSKMGLTLAAGRMPQNLNEIVITNYQLEMYKHFGIEVSNTRYPSDSPSGTYRYKQYEVQGWEDVEGKTISDMYPISNSYDSYVKKIVGLVEYDLSPYESLSNVYTVTTNPTPRQKKELLTAYYAKAAYLNKWIVQPGFYEAYFHAHENIFVNNLSTVEFTFDQKTYAPQSVSGYRLDDNLMHATTLIYWSGFHEYWTNADYINPNQMVISSAIANQLLPDELIAPFTNKSGQVHDRVGYTAMLEQHLFGKKMKVSVKKTFGDIYKFNNEVSELTVVAVWLITTNEFCPTPEFYSKYYTETFDSLIVRATSDGQAKKIISELNQLGTQKIRIDGTTYLLRFVPSTTHSHEVYALDGYFTIAVTIFRVVAMIFLVFSIILTYNFISTSINSQKKDIGILRSLGARRIDVAGIFIVEGLFIVILKLILSTALCYAGYLIVYNYFIDVFGYLAKTYQLISFGLRQLLLIGAITLTSVAAAITAPIIRIANKQPVDAIRGK